MQILFILYYEGLGFPGPLYNFTTPLLHKEKHGTIALFCSRYWLNTLQSTKGVF